MLFFASEIEQQCSKYQGNHLSQFLGNVFVFVKYASEMLKKLKYSGSLRLEIRMKQMRGVKWVRFEYNSPVDGPASELDDTIRVVSEVDSERLYHAPDEVALDIMKAVFSATNWTDLVKPSAIDKLIDAAYGFNDWPLPLKGANLQVRHSGGS